MSVLPQPACALKPSLRSTSKPPSTAGGRVTSDGGLVWLAEVDRELGLCESMASDVPLTCQTSEVGATLSPEEANALGSEMMEAVPSQSPNLQTFLANRGYTCGGRAEEILAMTPEERMQMPSDEKIELSMERQRMENEERSKMRQD